MLKWGIKLSEQIPTIEVFREKVFPGIPLFEIGEEMLTAYYNQFLKSKLSLEKYITEILIGE